MGKCGQEIVGGKVWWGKCRREIVAGKVMAGKAAE
jgi:hypothetical protein